jgi:hypothetical protein
MLFRLERADSTESCDGSRDEPLFSECQRYDIFSSPSDKPIFLFLDATEEEADPYFSELECCDRESRNWI